MKRKYDWFLMILFLINLVFQLFEENYMASIAWICAILTLGRILLFENEKLP